MKTLTHEIYKPASVKDADACSWVFSSPTTFEKYYYTLPPLAPCEVKIQVLSTGLCFSDSLFGREKWGPKSYPITTGHEVVGKII